MSYKIQINLNPNKEIDKLIIDNLNMDDTTNINVYVKDILYKLAKYQTFVQPQIPTTTTTIKQQEEIKVDIEEEDSKLDDRLLSNAPSLF